MAGRRPDQEPSLGLVPDGAVNPIEQIRRPRRIAGESFAAQGTIFTTNSRIFGEVAFRKDHGTEIDLTRQQTVDYIKAVAKYVRLYIKIEAMKVQLAKLGEPISKMNAEHPGLRGAVLKRLGKTITEVPEVTINKPDVIAIREAAGSTFPKYGTEQVALVAMVPEEPLKSGILLRGDDIVTYLHAAFHDMGMDDEEIAKHAGFIRRMDVTDKEELFRAVNKGLIPRDVVDPKLSKKFEVKPLPKEKVTKPRKSKTAVAQTPTA